MSTQQQAGIDLDKPMTKAEIDEIVYQCRQSGKDTTYDIVNAALARRSHSGGQADERELSKEQIDDIVYRCRQSGNDTTYDIVNAAKRAALIQMAGAPTEQQIVDVISKLMGEGYIDWSHDGSGDDETDAMNNREERAKITHLVRKFAAPAPAAAALPLAMVSESELRDIQSGRMGVPIRGAGWRKDQTIALYLAAHPAPAAQVVDAPHLQQRLLSLASAAIADECASLQEGGKMDVPEWANIVVQLYASPASAQGAAHADNQLLSREQLSKLDELEAKATALLAQAQQDAAPACAHVWNDFGQLGGRNVSWCPRCDKLAWTGKEPIASAAQDDVARAKAIHAAVSALYFDDSADFRSALGAVVRHLDARLAGEFLGSPKAAYDTACEMLAASQAKNGGEQ